MAKKRIFRILKAVAALAFLSFIIINYALGTAAVTPAVGGSAISADTTGGSYTALTGPVISEGAVADIGTGTIILNVPSGFIFDTGGIAPTVLVTRTAGNGANSKNINNVASGTSLGITSITTTQITFTVTNSTIGGVRNSLTWQNVRVRPLAGTPLASGNITESGTSSIVGIAGGTNFGTLTEVAGAKTQLVYTTQPSSSATVATDFATKPVIAVRDQFGNTVTSDNSTTITRTVVLSTQTCGGAAGIGTLTSTPANDAAVAAGVMIYTAMQYSVAESIKICASSSGLTSALSNTITVTVNNPVPTTTSISPATKIVGDAGFTLTVNGTNFISSSVVRFAGADRTTAFVNSTQLTASIPSSDLTTAGTFTITVFNPTPGGGISNAQTFTVSSAGAPPPPPPSPVIIPAPGTGGGVPPTNIIFSGSAYAGGKVKFFRRSTTDVLSRNTFVLDTETTADSNGKFKEQFQALLQGEYFFAVEAKDKDGHSSGILGFNANLISNNEVKADNIFVPPTIVFESAIVGKGKDLKIAGYSSPNNAVLLELDNVLTYGTQSNSFGYYTLNVSTRRFSAKDHFVKARQIDASGTKSQFSPTKTFTISPLSYPQADFDNNGIINIIDWSIFLFRYQSKDAVSRSIIDLDQNGKVDINDFSIFLKAMK